MLLSLDNERGERGEDVAGLLTRLPVRHISLAHDPAAYLAACVRRAARRAERAPDVVEVVEAAPESTTSRATAADRTADQAATHASAAAASDARAAGHELDAAEARSVADDSQTIEREDLHGEADARRSDAFGVAERAAAGTEHAAAAAARAALTPTATSRLQVVTRGQAGPAVRAAVRSQRRPVSPSRSVAPRRAERAAHR